jgi:hypothetical protein
MTTHQFAVTNARFVSQPGLPVAPASPAPTPVPLHKPRARHELAFSLPNSRCASTCGTATVVPLRLRPTYACAPLSRSPNRRPKLDISLRNSVFTTKSVKVPPLAKGITPRRISALQNLTPAKLKVKAKGRRDQVTVVAIRQ